MQLSVSSYAASPMSRMIFVSAAVLCTRPTPAAMRVCTHRVNDVGATVAMVAVYRWSTKHRSYHGGVPRGIGVLPMG